MVKPKGPTDVKMSMNSCANDHNQSLSLCKLWKILISNKINLCYTLLLFLNHFAYGVTVNILGATLVDLRFIYNVSLDTIAYVPVAVSIGYLIGSLAGWLYKWLNRQLMMIMFVFFLAITVTLVPHYGQFWVALVCLSLNGLGDGGYDAASSVWLVDMWPVGNSIFLQASQFMYGLGAIVAPILVAPYVYGEVNVTSDNRTLTVQDRVRDLTLPFQVNGIFQGIVPILMLILFCIRPYKNQSSLTKSSSGTSDLVSDDCSDSVATIPNRTAKLLLCGLCLATYATAELGYFSFSTAMFQYLEIGLSATDSAIVMSILSTTFTLGRLITALISIKLQPDHIISYHYAILMASVTVLYIGRNNLTVIYAATAALGYGFSAMWPALFAFTERYLRLTDRVCSCFTFLFGFTSLIIPFVLGQLFERYPSVLLVMEAIFITISLMLFVVVRVWIRNTTVVRQKSRIQNIN